MVRPQDEDSPRNTICSPVGGDQSLFDALACAAPGLVWVCDDEGRVEFMNSHWSAFTGLAQEQAMAHGWLDVIHPADAAAFRARISLGKRGTDNIQEEIRLRCSDGMYHRHVLRVHRVRGGKWVGCAIDAHDWLTTELRDATQGAILEMVISGAELSHLLNELCRAAERQIPGATCSILLVDAEEGKFVTGNAPNLPSTLINMLRGVRIGTGVGSCGTAAFERRDVITTDIATDPLWVEWGRWVLPLGFRACWSQPVFASSGEVIAAFGFYFRENRSPTPAEMRELARIRGLATLAIERARILEALRESEEHYRHTVEQNPQIPWTADRHGNILSVSSRWTGKTGIAQADALRQGWLEALHPDDVEATVGTWRRALASGQPYDMNYRIRLTSGEYRWTRARATARRDELGAIVRWYGTVEDIHEQYLANEKLKRQAFHDELTELPNRRKFVEELNSRLQAAGGFISLMVLDLDDFKLVNDRYGHMTGDAVLRLFARYLQRLKKENEFVARLGGDEFAIICEHVRDESCLLARAREIEDKLEAYLKTNKKTRSCRPSIGCAIGRPGDNPDEVFKRADLALYAAKGAGKGIVKLFDPSIRSAASRRSAAFDLARMALRENWVVPFYQPIVSLKDQSVRGYEALLRIRHPEKGILAPAAIMDALDDPRLADAIGTRMISLVIDDMASMAERGMSHGQVSINLATENLVNQEFVSNLQRLLASRKLPRKSIKLEITERVLMNELGSRVIENLNELRESGIGISLDDFGTGYASLVHLQSLPVDEIKIDRSFVSGLGTKANEGVIVQAMLGLAKALGLVTVAEGVETLSEARQLAEWGCDFGQGYLFGRPSSVEQTKSAAA